MASSAKRSVDANSYEAGYADALKERREQIAKLGDVINVCYDQAHGVLSSMGAFRHDYTNVACLDYEEALEAIEAKIEELTEDDLAL
jgi:hypothetical protein